MADPIAASAYHKSARPFTDTEQKVRVTIDDHAGTLPKFLTESIDDLLAADRARFEKHEQIPGWWLRHVERHAHPNTYAQDDARTKLQRHPRFWPFLASLTYWGMVGALLLWILRIHISDPAGAAILDLLLACVYGPFACAIIYLFREARNRDDVLWDAATLHVWARYLSNPFTSLWLTGKEMYAFLRAGPGGWTAASWDMPGTVSRLAAGFMARIPALDADLADLKRRIQALHADRNAAHVRLSASKGRDRVAVRIDEALAERLIERAIAMRALVERGDASRRELAALVEQYVALISFHRPRADIAVEAAALADETRLRGLVCREYLSLHDAVAKARGLIDTSTPLGDDATKDPAPAAVAHADKTAAR